MTEIFLPKNIWKFWLANSSDSSKITELPASNKTLQMVLNRPGSLSFSIPLNDPQCAEIEVLTTSIQAHRYSTLTGGYELIWSGPVWSLEESISDEKLNVNAVGWFELLNHRYLRYEKSYTSGSQTAGGIALDLLDIANNQKDGNISGAFPDGDGTTRPTGIVVGTNTDTQIRTRIYPKWQNIGQAIIEWSDIENGYDFEIHPEYKIMNVYPSAFPSTLRRDRPEVQFGFNWGPHNLLQFNITTESAELVNSQFAINQFSSALSQNTSSMNLYGIFENVQQLTEVNDTDVLQAYANGEVAIKSFAKVIYSILPQPYDSTLNNIPEPFVDYRLGDHVYVSAIYPPRINVDKQAVRVYAMTISVDENGSERISTLQVSP